MMPSRPKSGLSSLMSLACAMLALGESAAVASDTMSGFSSHYKRPTSGIRHGNNRKEQSAKRHAKAKAASKARRKASKARRGK